jgi:hypothetical protein
MSSKGSQWERDFCHDLSKWWTNGLGLPIRDDVFWRASNSGGRATARMKKDKTTANSYGDVGLLDPIGQPLLDYSIMECKRGYSKHTFADLIDKPNGAATQKYEEWFIKIQECCEAAKAPNWMLVAKRDRRLPLIYMREYTAEELTVEGSPCASFHVPIGEYNSTVEIVVLLLEDFWQSVRPRRIVQLVEDGKCSND